MRCVHNRDTVTPAPARIADGPRPAGRGGGGGGGGVVIEFIVYCLLLRSGCPRDDWTKELTEMIPTKQDKLNSMQARSTQLKTARETTRGKVCPHVLFLFPFPRPRPTQLP